VKKLIDVLVEMQLFPEVWWKFAELGYFLKWVWQQFFISIWQPWVGGLRILRNRTDNLH